MAITPPGDPRGSMMHSFHPRSGTEGGAHSRKACLAQCSWSGRAHFIAGMCQPRATYLKWSPQHRSPQRTSRRAGKFSSLAPGSPAQQDNLSNDLLMCPLSNTDLSWNSQESEHSKGWLIPLFVEFTKGEKTTEPLRQMTAMHCLFLQLVAFSLLLSVFKVQRQKQESRVFNLGNEN